MSDTRFFYISPVCELDEEGNEIDFFKNKNYIDLAKEVSAFREYTEEEKAQWIKEWDDTGHLLAGWAAFEQHSPKMLLTMKEYKAACEEYLNSILGTVDYIKIPASIAETLANKDPDSLTLILPDKFTEAEYIGRLVLHLAKTDSTISISAALLKKDFTLTQFRKIQSLASSKNLRVIAVSPDCIPEHIESIMNKTLFAKQEDSDR
jgi:hypothetical protein